MILPFSKPKRFPGVASFEDDALASELFYGRETESQKLLHYILAEHLVVFFSYSGYGKTSLLKASVFKKLREKNFYPALIRFNKKNYAPQTLIKTELLAIDENEGYEVIQKSTTDDFKDFFKGLEIWSADDKLLTPVLVFDQFEELFTLDHNREYLSSFFETLAMLLKESKESGIQLKMVISIREDFLGHLEEMAKNIPSVFTNRFRLEALKKEAAQKAITEPAKKVLPDVEFASPPFTFSTDAINQLLDFLSMKVTEGVWRPSEDIEPIQLQIICSELENKVINGEVKQDTANQIIIDPVDFGGKEGLQNIIAHFYDQQIAAVQKELHLDYAAVSSLKEVIETGLIAGIRRVPMAYDSLIARPGVNKEAIDLLIKSKLLKLESHHGNNLVEISHDTLVEPILKSLSARVETEKKEKRKKKIIRYSLIGFFVAALLGYIIYSIFSAKTANQEKYYYAALMGGRENPTLGYKIALDGEKIGSTTTKLKALLDQFRNGNYAFITNSFSVEGKLISAYIPAFGKEIKITNERSTQLRDRNGNFGSYAAFNESGIDGTCLINGHYFILVAKGDSIDILDEKNALYKKVSVQPGQTLDVPNDEELLKYLMSGTEHLLMDAYSVNWRQAKTNSYLFLNDGGTAILSKDRQYLLLQYENLGYLHDLSTNSYYRFSPADTAFVSLSAKEQSRNYKRTKENTFSNLSNTTTKDLKSAGVQAMAVSNDFKQLVYASGDTVKVLDISTLQEQKNLGASNKNAIKLIGHIGPVNSISISPNDSFILTGGSDNVAILWNFKGERKALLKGHKSKIIYTGFSMDSKEMITGDDRGHLLVWRLGKDVLPASLVKFSPFDYHALGLTEPKYNLGKLYDTSGFRRMISATLHYNASLPNTNIYPGDINYFNNLQSSVTEVEQLFESIFRKDSFQHLSPYFKSTLYKKYTNLLFNNPALIANQNAMNEKDKERLSQFYDQRIAGYISSKDKTSYEDLCNEIDAAAQHFVDAEDYTEANRFFMKKAAWLQSLQKQQPSVERYKFDLAPTFTSIAYYDILNGDFKSAITASNKALATDSMYTLAYTNLALAHLFLNQYKEAEAIYVTYKQELLYPFLQDFEDLEKAGLINKNKEAVYNEVQKIKGMLYE